MITNTLYEESLNSHELRGTQSKGIHDIPNAQKFAMNFGAISKTVHQGKLRENLLQQRKKMNGSNVVQ